MTYIARATMGKDNIQWAYEWKNGVGLGAVFEPNVVLVGNGYIRIV
jgi:hypothetical protein